MHSLRVTVGSQPSLCENAVLIGRLSTAQLSDTDEIKMETKLKTECCFINSDMYTLLVARTRSFTANPYRSHSLKRSRCSKILLVCEQTTPYTGLRASIKKKKKTKKDSPISRVEKVSALTQTRFLQRCFDFFCPVKSKSR